MGKKRDGKTRARNSGCVRTVADELDCWVENKPNCEFNTLYGTAIRCCCLKTLMPIEVVCLFSNVTKWCKHLSYACFQIRTADAFFSKDSKMLVLLGLDTDRTLNKLNRRWWKCHFGLFVNVNNHMTRVLIVLFPIFLCKLILVLSVLGSLFEKSVGCFVY